MSAILGVVAIVLIFSLVYLLQSSTKEFAYLNALLETRWMAESAQGVALGRLTFDINAFQNVPLRDNFTASELAAQAATGHMQKYETFALPHGFPGAPNGIYLTTVASNTIHGQEYVIKLHTYADVSNLGDYFLAVNDSAQLSWPINVALGKVYSAGVLTLNTNFPNAQDSSTLTQTTVDKVVYVQGLSYSNPQNSGDTVNGGRVVINNGEQQLDVPLLFPQLLTSDMDYFKELARSSNMMNGRYHQMCTFTKNTYWSRFTGGLDLAHVSEENHIFPPGYPADGNAETLSAQDHYDDVLNDGSEGNNSVDPTNYSYFYRTTPGDVNVPVPNNGMGHSFDDRDHVYYCPGNMTVEGIVHGQVLFVAEGNIIISSSVVSAAPTDPLPSGSLAHQAIFITRGSVIVQNSLVAAVPSGVVTENIQGMVYAPHGSFYPVNYTPTSIHNSLKLNFIGSIIIKTNTGIPSTFPTVFRAGRDYSYMLSLKQNPPPYLPAIVEIHHSFEEVLAAGGAPH